MNVNDWKALLTHRIEVIVRVMLVSWEAGVVIEEGLSQCWGVHGEGKITKATNHLPVLLGAPKISSFLEMQPSVGKSGKQYWLNKVVEVRMERSIRDRASRVLSARLRSLHMNHRKSATYTNTLGETMSVPPTLPCLRVSFIRKITDDNCHPQHVASIHASGSLLVSSTGKNKEQGMGGVYCSARKWHTWLLLKYHSI